MSVGDIARTAGGIALITGAQVARTPQARSQHGLASGLALPAAYDASRGAPTSTTPRRVSRRSAPGDLIRAEPMHAYLAPGVRLRAHAWRILYRSTGAIGEPTAVSGHRAAPAWLARQATVPLVAYAIGTHGIGDDAAPSRLLSTGRDWEAGLMALILARGYATVVTDYQGLGTAGDHVYMVGRALGCNVLDAIRAARQLAPAELPETVRRRSWATQKAARRRPGRRSCSRSYAPELELAGVAAGAAAADVELAGPTLDGSFFSFFVAYGAIGYAAAYPDLEFESYLVGTSARDGRPPCAAATSCRRRSAARGLPAWIVLPTPTSSSYPTWRARLRENRLGHDGAVGAGAAAPRPSRSDRRLRALRAAARGLAGAGRGGQPAHHARRL